MTTQASEAKVTDIIPTTSVPVTEGTVKWIEALYHAGAITFHPDRSVKLDPEIRNLIVALHATLAGGEVSVQVRHTGGATFTRLEELFERAWAEAAVANENRDDDEVLPFTP